MKSVLTYVTLNTSGFENDLSFCVQFLRGIDVNRRAWSNLSSTKIFDTGCRWLWWTMCGYFTVIWAIYNNEELYQNMSATNGSKTIFSRCYSLYLFRLNVIRFRIYLPIQRYWRFRIDSRALYCSEQTRIMCGKSIYEMRNVTFLCWNLSRHFMSATERISCSVDRASLYNLFQMKPTRCTLLLSIFISTSLHGSGNYVPIIRRTYCIYATLVFFTLYGWLSGLLQQTR